VENLPVRIPFEDVSYILQLELVGELKQNAELENLE